MSAHDKDKKSTPFTTSSTSSSYSWGSGYWGRSKKSYKSRLGFGRFYGDDDDDLGGGYYGSYGRSSYYRPSYYSTPSYTASSSSKTKSSKTSEELQKFIRTAYNEVKDLVNVLDFPFRVNIYLDRDGEAREKMYVPKGTSDRSIYISSSILFSEDKRSDAEKIEIFSGLGLHEAAHLMYTRLKDYQELFGTHELSEMILFRCVSESLVGKFISKLSKNNDILNSCLGIIVYLSGLVEDERIESTLLEERQGWADYIEKQKEYSKKGYTLSSVSEDKVNINEFINTLVNLLRYRESVDESILRKYSKSYEEVTKVMTNPPTSTFESIIKSLQIFKILLGIISSEGKSVDDVFVPRSDNKEGEEEEFNEEDIKKLSKFLSTLGALNALNGCKNSLKSHCSFPLPLSGVDISLSESDSEAFKRGLDRRSSDEETMIDVSRGVIENGTSTSVFFRHPVGNPGYYNKLLGEVSEYIPTMKTLIKNMNKNYDFTIHGQRSGKLDTAKLVEAYQGVPQVYTKTGMVRTSGVHICVVLDESGSMGGTRAQKARLAGILMNESFGFIPGVELYIYGHTADLEHYHGTYGCYSTDINIYREPGLVYKSRPGTGLSEVKGRCENRDGTAIREIAARIRKFTQQPVLMFILSDGEPSANYYRGEVAIEDTGKAVKEISDKGFYPIQITIDNGSLPERTVKKMFKTYIDLTKDLNTLPHSLSAVVQKEISRALQENQSFTQM